MLSIGIILEGSNPAEIFLPMAWRKDRTGRVAQQIDIDAATTFCLLLYSMIAVRSWTLNIFFIIKQLGIQRRSGVRTRRQKLLRPRLTTNTVTTRQCKWLRKEI